MSDGKSIGNPVASYVKRVVDLVSNYFHLRTSSSKVYDTILIDGIIFYLI